MEDKERLENLEALLSDYDTLIKGYEEDVAYLDFESVFEQYVTNDKGKFFQYLDGMTTQKNSKAPKIRKYLTEEAQKISSGFNKLQIFDFEEFDTVQKNIAIDYLTDILKKDGILKNYYDIHKSFFVYFARFWIDFIKDASSADLLDDEIARSFIMLGSYITKIELCATLRNDDYLKEIHSHISSQHITHGRYQDRENKRQKVRKEAIKLFKNGDKRSIKNLSIYFYNIINADQLEASETVSRKRSDGLISDEEHNAAKKEFDKHSISQKDIMKLLKELANKYRQTS